MVQENVILPPNVNNKNNIPPPLYSNNKKIFNIIIQIKIFTIT